ncbi:MAG: nucleotidyl transferase AbiEii/AbiGii toxin family protein [Sphaerochaeta sp.]|nr:nucleotidyl transferase AbiEii/AbiGii toxin family protein [Sphaerochaeta sp.]
MMRSAMQLKAIMRNISKEKSADAYMLLRTFMMERFLERLSLSSYKNSFILKGGMLVAAMVGLEARSTMDLDTTAIGIDVNEAELKGIVLAIVAIHLEDGVIFSSQKYF